MHVQSHTSPGKDCLMDPSHFAHFSVVLSFLLAKLNLTDINSEEELDMKINCYRLDKSDLNQS